MSNRDRMQKAIANKPAPKSAPPQSPKPPPTQEPSEPAPPARQKKPPKSPKARDHAEGLMGRYPAGTRLTGSWDGARWVLTLFVPVDGRADGPKEFTEVNTGVHKAMSFLWNDWQNYQAKKAGQVAAADSPLTGEGGSARTEPGG